VALLDAATDEEELGAITPKFKRWAGTNAADP